MKHSIAHSRHTYAFGRFVLAIILICGVSIGLPDYSVAQERPRTPSISTTTQENPRGADIVEPMAAYKVSIGREGITDTTYLGVARIPDPRLGEDGAFVQRDVRTGTLIRISDAIILTDDGLRRIVEFDPGAREQTIVFVAGPHDIVRSRQGVNALRSRPGHETVFSLNELYDAAQLNPLTGTAAAPNGVARTALLRMESTYPGGEAVPLSLLLVPRERPAPVQSIQIVRRDTTVFRSPNLTYLISPPPPPPRMFTVLATVESGFGPRFVRTAIPASIRDPFTTQGWADIYFVDGTLQVERATHRWRAHLFGSSSLVDSDVAEIAHHQVVVHGDLRFEYGTRAYIAVEAGGRLADKPHQEFNWKSADYAGGVRIGPGRRATDMRGLERHRYEALVGLRMGESRVIEVYEAGTLARGLGPEVILGGQIAQIPFLGSEIRLRAEAGGYVIVGRGPRDSGFRERGVRAHGDIILGREILGMFAFASLQSTMRSDRATYPNDDHYFQTDAYVMPALGVEMRF